MNDFETTLASGGSDHPSIRGMGAVPALGRKTNVVIDYTNYNGERSYRSIIPLSMYFGSTEYHQDSQWLLYAYDLDKNADRTFAMKDIHRWVQDQ